MKKIFLLPVLLGVAVLASLRGPAAPVAADVGSPFPEVELEGFSQTEADTFADFTGRAVLIEFFAYW